MANKKFKSTKFYKVMSNNKGIVAVSVSVVTLFGVSVGFYASYRANTDFTLAVWPEYITTQQYNYFKEKTGLQVGEVYFESNENLLSKVNTTSYDMLMPTDYIVEGLIENGAVEKLDYDLENSQLSVQTEWDKYMSSFTSGDQINGVPYEDVTSSNYDENFTDVWQAVSSVYPMGESVMGDYVVPYQTSDIKIVYNLTDPVVQLMFEQRPDLIGSYESFLWIAQHDGTVLANKNMRDFMSMGLKATGHSINDYSEEALEDTYNFLAQIMPNTMLQHDDLARTAAHLDSWSVGYAFPGDFVMGIADEWLAENGDLPWYEAMLFTEPKEGSVVYFDIMSQGRGSSKDEYTNQFITFLSQPDVQAGAGYESAESSGIATSINTGNEEIDSKYDTYYQEMDQAYKNYYGGLDYIYYAPANKYVYEGTAVDVDGDNGYGYFCMTNGQNWEDDAGMPYYNGPITEDIAIANGMTPESSLYKNDWEEDYIPSNNNCFDPSWEMNTKSIYSNGYGFSDEVISNWFASPNYVNLYYQALQIHTDFDNDVNGDGIFDIQQISTDASLQAIYGVNNSEDFLFNRPTEDEFYRYSPELTNAMSRVYNELLALQNKLN